MFTYMLLLLLLIIDVYLLTPAVVAQIFNPIAELLIPIGIPSKEEKEESEAQPVTAKLK